MLWPNIERKKREFRIFPTHDVDLPFQYKNHSLLDIILLIGGDLLKRKDLFAAVNNLSQWSIVKTGRKPDPFDNFDWIMDQSDKAGHRSTFNFVGGSHHPNDPCYNLTANSIRNLIFKITQRGHQLGFHPGYRTAMDKQAWKCEYNKFKAVISDKNVDGGRQHMLCFRNPETWRMWEENGLQYDSTLMFADHAGFRCGICYEYPVFDLKRKQKLKLIERPLIIMDCTVIDKRYMSLGQTAEAFDFMNQLRDYCKFFGGNFVILWHNDRFTNEKEKEIYKALIN
jgi:hypothetical protein